MCAARRFIKHRIEIIFEKCIFQGYSCVSNYSKFTQGAAFELPQCFTSIFCFCASSVCDLPQLKMLDLPFKPINGCYADSIILFLSHVRHTSGEVKNM